VLKIGLTGGIGAGKSAVGARLVERGAVLIDADLLAREVVAPGTDGLREVAARFGADVLTADGALDRPALGARVFGDDEARRALESIIHPRVRARTAELTVAAPVDAIVVNDVPLLVETGLAPSYALVLVVTAAEPTRVGRLARTRGMTEAEAYARIRAQASDERRRAAADVLLDNDGALADLHAAVDALWRDRLVPFEANLRAGRRAPRARVPVLAEPDPTWPEQAARLTARLAFVAGQRARRIDHIGSTAVPGLPAKDLVDAQVVVPNLATARELADDLRAAGLVRAAGRWPDIDRSGVEHDKEVAVDADPGRPVNVHIRPASSPAWREALLFRDWLRANEAARDAYAAMKRALAARPGADVDTYGDAKLPWISEALGRAEDWATATGWTA
jgi:dephospho-CoA kinase